MKRLVFIFLIFTACSEQKYPFASFMRVKIEPYIYCEGLVRNYLGFGYYQVDGIWCERKEGGETRSAKIVHERDMKQYWDHFDLYHYSPAHQNTDLDKRYFNLGSNKWVKAEPYIHH